MKYLYTENIIYTSLSQLEFALEPNFLYLCYQENKYRFDCKLTQTNYGSVIVNTSNKTIEFYPSSIKHIIH